MRCVECKGPHRVSCAHGGFTLIELMVSTCIICILAAILFPVFSRARERARQTRCQTNLHQIGLALSLYARDHAGHFPPTNDNLAPLLGRYLLVEEVLHCPTRGVGGPSGRTTGQASTKIPAFDYFYRAGFCDDDDPDTLLVCDSQLDRHNGGCDALFADGHCNWLRYEATYGQPRPPDDPLQPILKERKEYILPPSGVMPRALPGGSP